MKCPFTAHLERFEAAEAGHVVIPGQPPVRTGTAATEYELMRASLGNDLRQLSNTQSLEKKIELKRQMIDRYRDWVDGAMASETPAEDDIVATMLVWSIDIADWPLALDLARYVLANGLTLPERYKRTPGTLVAEEFAEAGIAEKPTIDLATLLQAEALTEFTDMPDQVRAKVKKAIGLSFKAKVDAFDPEAESGVAGGKPALIAVALLHLERAVELDSKCGVKKIITSLKAEAKRLAPENAE